MAQYEDSSTRSNVPREPVRRSSGNGILFIIIGGLVVAVAIIAWFVFGGDTNTSVTTVPADSSETSVTIENTAPAATEGGAAMQSAPATDGGGDAAAPAANDGGDAAAPATNDGGDAAAPAATGEQPAPAN